MTSQYKFIFEVKDEINYTRVFPNPFIYNSWFAFQSLLWWEDSYEYEDELYLTLFELQQYEPEVNQIPIGSIGFVHKFMEKLGVEPPQPLNIPDSVRLLTNYPTKLVTIEQVLNEIGLPVFIKPTKLKQFDGGVIEVYDILNYMLAHNKIDYQTQVLIRDPFPEEIEVEYRIPVFNNRILAAQPYNGVYSSHLDWILIKEICGRFNSKESPYIIDIGIGKDTGTNYLIELSHFYSTSLYGVEDIDLIKAQLRWWLLNVNNKL